MAAARAALLVAIPGSAMNASSTKLAVLSLAVAMAAGPSLAADAAEKKRFKWTHTARQTVAEMRSIPVPDHELVQGIYIDAVQAESPDFDVIEARSINQDDTLKDTGRHRGVETLVFRNGDTAITQYEGTHRVLFRGIGAWEVSYEGKFDFVNGTGRFKNIQGLGTYRGHITPYGSLTEYVEAEVEY
jgi:hypothetical protein